MMNLFSKDLHRIIPITVLLLAGLIVLPVLSGKAYAVEVNAFVDRTKISATDSVNLTVVIKDGEGEVDISSMKDFRAVSRGSSSSVRIVNSEMSKETSYNYTLLPLKKGDLIIPSLSVEVAGKIHQTNEIPIVVSEAKKMEENEASSDVFMTSSISNKTPFVGQQFSYTVKVFHAAQIANARYQQPEFKGFDEKKVEPDRRYTSVVASKQYTVIELNYVLIPINPGHFSVEPAVLSCDVAQPQGRSGSRFDPFFDDPFFSRSRFVHRTVSSEPVEVDVQPLPPYNGDVPFSGLVGNFELNSAIDKTQAVVGDSLTFSIGISGAGNIVDATEPELNLSESFKVYKDAPEEKIEFAENGYSGKRTFRWALVPVKAGEAVLPTITYAYFDVSNEQYRILKTEPIKLTIIPSKEKQVLPTEDSEENQRPLKFEKKQVKFMGRDVLPLKEEIDAIASRTNLSFLFFALFFMLPMAGFGIVKCYMISRTKKIDDKTLMAQRAMQSLKNAAKPNLTEEAFLAALYSALISAVHSIAGTKSESLTYIEAKQILVENGFAQEQGDETAKLLERIESARYGRQSLSASDKTTLLDETKNRVRRIL